MNYRWSLASRELTPAEVQASRTHFDSFHSGDGRGITKEEAEVALASCLCLPDGGDTKAREALAAVTKPGQTVRAYLSA